MQADLATATAALSTHARALPRVFPVHAGPEPTIKLSEVVGLLRRNAGWICLCAVIAAAAVYAIAATLPKTYTAESTVAVAGDRFALPQLQGALQSESGSDPMPLVRTEMQAIGSRQLISELIDELHLDKLPEFNGALRPPSLLGSLRARLTALITPTPAVPSPNALRDGIVNAVTAALAIAQDGRSLVIDVSFNAQDPLLAATVVNRLIADYVAKRAARLDSADTRANAAMNVRIQQVGDDIAKLEQKMHSLRSESGVVTLRAGSVGQQQVEDLTIELSKSAVARSEIQANLSRASAAASSGSADELSAVLSSSTITRLRDQESQAAATVADMSAQFGAAYPGLQSAQSHLQAVRAQLGGEARRIVASLSMQLKVAQAHEADVQRQLTEAHKAGAAGQDIQSQIDQLQQDITTRRTLYGTLLAAAQQTAAKPSDAVLPDVRVLSAASPPGQPSAPKMKLVAGFGGLAGGLLAGLVAFTYSTSRPRFRSSSEVVQATGAHLLAKINPRALRFESAGGALARPRRQDDAIQAALRRLRGTASGATPRTIVVIGAQAGRQAAETALALARAASADGQTALMIEYGGVHGDHLRTHPGLSAAVLQPQLGARGWRDAITRDPNHPADLLFGFLRRASPHQLTASLENLLIEAREDYDTVVLGAPDHRDPEAQLLARSCDATILVVDMAVASPETTHGAAVELIAVARSSLGVIVLNQD